MVKQTSAQWVDETPVTDSRTSNAWKLRWRSPANVASPSSPSVASQKPLAVSRAVVWNQVNDLAPPGRSPLRTASQQVPVDPFEEPAPSPTQSLPGQPERSVLPRTQSEFADPFADDAARPQPTVPDSAPRPIPSDLPPQGPVTPMPESDLAPVPPRDLTLPDSYLGPSRSDFPCERVYNDRNCCADDAKCRQAQRFVAQQKITDIVLDITPSFTNTEGPSSATYVPTDVRKEQELAKAPSRVWKNRAGERVAEGRFDEYRNGLIHVLREDGQTDRIAFNTLSDDDVCFVTAWWSLPTECSLVDQEFQPREWLASTLTWKASSLCHKPLYFEEVALERYGHSVGPVKQPFISGAHFFGSLITLPYQMGIHPPNECQYALGYYRPGSCAPWLIPAFPVSLRGALAEAGVIVGGIYIFP